MIARKKCFVPKNSFMRAVASAFAGATLLSLLVSIATAADSLANGFVHPPDSARPWVYWYFMDGNLTGQGMKADLEAMKQAGIGGAIFLEVNIGIPRGPVDFMSPRWQDLFADAVDEAARLGIQIAVGAGPGWCGTGGPWIKPQLAMQDLVAGVTNVAGPAQFSAVLPLPQPRKPFFGLGTLTPELKKEWEDFYRDVAVLAFPTPAGTNRIPDVDEKALYFRAPFSSAPGVKSCLPSPASFPALPAKDCIAPGQIVDLTKKMSPDGRLIWDVPPGQWTLMRFGRRLTGQTTRPAPKPGLGFESDKFDRAALDAQYNNFVRKLLTKIGPHRNPSRGLTMVHFDSWEMSSQNWSPGFRAEFRKRRGYDPLKYLPALSGGIVGSEEISERFLWDLRRTAQEMVVENHLGYLKKLAHRDGLTLSVEPYDMNPCGDLTLGRVADVPQCEFWYVGFDTSYSVIEAASIAHTCGRPMVAAEAFTSAPGEDWKADPAALKPLGDWAFCAGVNRFDFHRFQAQPWTNRWPGMTMGPYGVHWDRTQTWWDMVPAYHEYLARCQFLLQRGVTVADVCFLAAEGAPYVFRPPASAMNGTPPDHLGYNFDGCAPETLLERATVRDGRLVFPDGTRYRVLVLPEAPTMTPPLLRKIRQLVREGATVFGPPPLKSPSLQDFPKCDGEIKRLARQLWGDCDGKTVFAHQFGKGRVVWRVTQVKPGEQYGDFAAITNLLREMGVAADFEADRPIRFTHRRDGKTDIYFVANRDQKPINANCIFRVGGGQPELWNPLTGATRPLPQFERKAGRTIIPMHFDPAQSFFVIFRPRRQYGQASTRFASHASSPGPQSQIPNLKSQIPNFPPLKQVFKLSGPWNVSFDPKWGGPPEIVFASLQDWTQRPEPGIKYYSGKAVYRKSFALPAEVLRPSREYFLDLGEVKNLAHVWLNGHDLGVVWCAPWRVKVTGILRPGTNQLQIEVANLWPNRLIGDLSLPPKERFTWTTWNPFKKDSPLLPSGLLGPVAIVDSAY
jgi:(4-O-methyl)-D-glucuronate---lignin esterase